MIPLNKGKYIIGGLWLVGFTLIFALMTVQTIGGTVYADRGKEAWEWVTPHLLPTIGLIIGVFIADGQNPKALKGIRIQPFLVIVAFMFSFVHLAILLVVIVSASNRLTVDETFATLKSANLPLGFIQGLVALTLGIFFKK